MTIEENVPLGRLTTVGIGGPARHFARPQSVAELEDALRWASAEGLDVYTVGPVSYTHLTLPTILRV